MDHPLRAVSVSAGLGRRHLVSGKGDIRPTTGGRSGSLGKEWHLLKLLVW